MNAFRRKEQLVQLCRDNHLDVSGNTAALLDRLAVAEAISKEQFEEFQRHAAGRSAAAVKSVVWPSERIDDADGDGEEEGDAEEDQETVAARGESRDLRTVRHTLKKALRIDDPDMKDRVLQRIEGAVAAVSRMLRRASLFVVLHCNRVAGEGVEFPLAGWTDTEWRHCLLIGNEGHATAPIGSAMDTSIYETYRRHSDLFPPVPIEAGLSQAVTQAARDLSATFKRSLWCATMPYLRRLCKGWLNNVWDELPVVKDRVKADLKVVKKTGKIKLKLQTVASDRPTVLQLVRAIESGNLRSDLLFDPAVMEFVEDVRCCLGLQPRSTSRLTSAFLKRQAQAATMFAFKRRLQETFEEWDVKNVTTSPIFKVKRHFVLLDRSCWRHILTACGVKRPDDEHPDDWLRRIVCLPRDNGRMTWSLSLRTDGVSANMTYTKGPSPRRPVDTEVAQTDVEGGPLPELKDAIVVGGDPGAVQILTLSSPHVLGDDGRPLVWSLTRKQFYHLSGIEAATRRNRDRIERAGMTEKWEKLSRAETSLRTSSVDGVVKYLSTEAEIRDDWWAFALRRVHSQDRFRTQGGRKRVLDKFFHKIVKDIRERVGEDREIVVAYGAATFGASGKGRLTTPTTSVYKACLRHFSTYKQGECRTSRQHHGCFGDLHQCWIHCKLDMKVDETDRERPIQVDLRVRGPPGEDVPHGTHVPKNAKGLRGLQYCPTCDRFLNRDRNSALCIAKLFVITRIDGSPVPPEFKPRYKCSKVANGNSPPREANG